MSNNGPTFTKATYDHKGSKYDHPSPARNDAEHEQTKRDAADAKLFRIDPTAWLKKHGLLSGNKVASVERVDADGEPRCEDPGT